MFLIRPHILSFIQSNLCSGGRRAPETYWSAWSSRLKLPAKRWCSATYSRYNVHTTLSSDEYKVRIIRITFHRERHRYHRDNFLFSQGVAERGVSVVATKNIIDAVKVVFSRRCQCRHHQKSRTWLSNMFFLLFQGVWLSVNRDLEEAKSNIEVCAIMIISNLVGHLIWKLISGTFLSSANGLWVWEKNSAKSGDKNTNSYRNTRFKYMQILIKREQKSWRNNLIKNWQWSWNIDYFSHRGPRSEKCWKQLFPGWFIDGDASTLGRFVQESLRGGLPEICQVRWGMRTMFCCCWWFWWYLVVVRW